MNSLKLYSTFHIDVVAKELVTINDKDDIQNLIKSDSYKENSNRLILGGGSNILFTQDYDGIVIVNALKGRTIIKELNNSIIISIASGEIRDDTVMRSVNQ
jgi:UDP-N-acetylmuramate dehydrogenase